MAYSLQKCQDEESLKNDCRLKDTKRLMNVTFDPGLNPRSQTLPYKNFLFIIKDIHGILQNSTKFYRLDISIVPVLISWCWLFYCCNVNELPCY